MASTCTRGVFRTAMPSAQNFVGARRTPHILMAPIRRPKSASLCCPLVPSRATCMAAQPCSPSANQLQRVTVQRQHADIGLPCIDPVRRLTNILRQMGRGVDGKERIGIFDLHRDASRRRTKIYIRIKTLLSHLMKRITLAYDCLMVKRTPAHTRYPPMAVDICSKCFCTAFLHCINRGEHSRPKKKGRSTKSRVATTVAH
jgi:hypothetical protein